MPDCLAREGGDRRDAAQVRERGLGAQPLRTVAGRDQQRGRGIGGDPGHRKQRRRGLLDQPVQLGAQAAISADSCW
jgi:hypothetical protein